MSRFTVNASMGLGRRSGSGRPASYKSNKDPGPGLLQFSMSRKRKFSSCIIDGSICIESIDLLKFYHQKTRSLKVAVRVVDPKRRPVSMAEVTLITESPGGQSRPWRRLTDGDGVVSFEMNNPDHGEWYVWVTGVSHPFHGSESYDLLTLPLTTYV